jgi:hypothetical protein
MESCMTVRYRLTAVLVFLAVTATLFGMQTMSQSGMQSGHEAHCHDSGADSSTQAPQKSPPKYQCCANGHSFAIISTAFSLERLSAMHLVLSADETDLSRLACQPEIVRYVLLSVTPSRSSPLRV